MSALRIVLIKPSKYGLDGYVERFKKGFIPNATLYHIASLTPARIDGTDIIVETIDEYVRDDLDYLSMLRPQTGVDTLLALVGVQSHQFHRALDLAAHARENGVRHCVIGGPHVMTCDTEELHGRGVSFALAEAELVWEEILGDALDGELKPVYGREQRWATDVNGPVVIPPPQEELDRYWSKMLGLYPVRGCPYKCNFCSVIKISGRHLRRSSIDTTMQSLQRARDAGVERVMFVSDNFNKYPEAPELLEAMIERKLGLEFFCQCDCQVAKQPELIELLGRAGCFEMFIGVESFDRSTLKAAGKFHNHPKNYGDLIAQCRAANIRAHFSSIIGFPEQREADIAHHVEVLKELSPDVASFYILTPIPGTDQYATFKREGVIFEKNLDRFDATCVTWRHPHIGADRLRRLLFDSYMRFYASLVRKGGLSIEAKNLVVFNYLSASKNTHPNSGGISQTRRDRVGDYIELRRRFYDLDLVPLPENLALSAADELSNKKVDWAPKRAANG